MHQQAKLCKIFTITAGNFHYIDHCAKYPLEVKKIKATKRLILKMKQVTCITMVLANVCNIKIAYFDSEEIPQQTPSPLHLQTEPTDCKNIHYKDLACL